MKQRIEISDFVEILEREITGFGNGSHIILPQKHKGRKAIVIIKE